MIGFDDSFMLLWELGFREAHGRRFVILTEWQVRPRLIEDKWWKFVTRAIPNHFICNYKTQREKKCNWTAFLHLLLAIKSYSHLHLNLSLCFVSFLSNEMFDVAKFMFQSVFLDMCNLLFDRNLVRFPMIVLENKSEKRTKYLTRWFFVSFDNKLVIIERSEANRAARVIIYQFGKSSRCQLTNGQTVQYVFHLNASREFDKFLFLFARLLSFQSQQPILFLFSLLYRNENRNIVYHLHVICNGKR